MSRMHEPYAAADLEAMSPWHRCLGEHPKWPFLHQLEDDQVKFEELSRCNEQWRLCVWWSEVNQ
jgi:hypothetical protein